MTKPSDGGRPRRQRRADERLARKNVRQRQRLGALLPGGSPEQPVEVRSGAVIEVQARATVCLQCGGALALNTERATSTPRGVLRELRMSCRRCHAPRALWFRIVSVQA